MSRPRPKNESELIEYVRSNDVRAPDELHRKVDALVKARSPAARWRLSADREGPTGRSRFALGFAATIAIAAVLVVVVAGGLRGGGSATPSVRQTAALTLRAATTPAPAESTSRHGQLSVAVDGVAFPYWEDHFGWRSTGARSDRLDGRTVTTVFYEDARGRRLGYAIVAGTPAPPTSGGTVIWRDGVPYRLLSENGAHVITWLRDGHLCVVSGRGVDNATLLRLASWVDSGAVAS